MASAQSCGITTGIDSHQTRRYLPRVRRFDPRSELELSLCLMFNVINPFTPGRPVVFERNECASRALTGIKFRGRFIGRSNAHVKPEFLQNLLIQPGYGP